MSGACVEGATGLLSERNLNPDSQPLVGAPMKALAQSCAPRQPAGPASDGRSRSPTKQGCATCLPGQPRPIDLRDGRTVRFWRGRARLDGRPAVRSVFPADRLLHAAYPVIFAPPTYGGQDCGKAHHFVVFALLPSFFVLTIL